MREIGQKRASPLYVFRRAFTIPLLVGWHVLLFGWHSFRQGRHWRASLSSTLGECLASLCESLGLTFIKAGQILSCRPDLLSPAITTPLSKLQDQIAPFDVRRLPRLLDEAFGRPMEDVFSSFDFTPVSAASIAHVHKASLKDGRTVAVKIRRPDLARLIEADLALLRLLTCVLSRFPFTGEMPFREIVEEVGQPILQQLDFRLEAENMRRFSVNFARHEHIKFPQLVDELCNDSVLVMEFLPNLQKISATTLTMEERKVAALSGLRALYKMIFIDGFMHADMHPGNVFTREGGEFVILDTGLVSMLSDADQKDFADFFFGLVNNQSLECSRIIYESALHRAKTYVRESFEAEMAVLIARHSALKSRDFEITRFVYELIDTQRRHGVRGSTKFIMTILSMVVFDGICKQLYPECDFQAEARGFLITARYRRQPSAAPTGGNGESHAAPQRHRAVSRTQYRTMPAWRPAAMAQRAERPPFI